MSEDTESVRSWFAARLPEEWFSGPADISVEGGEVTVLGSLADPALEGATPEVKAAAEAGRIARFREESRPQRIGIAREAGERYGVNVTWGAICGGTTTLFTRPTGERRRRREWHEGRGEWWGRRGPWRGPWGGPWSGRWRGPWDRRDFRRMMARALWRRFAQARSRRRFDA